MGEYGRVEGGPREYACATYLVRGRSENGVFLPVRFSYLPIHFLTRAPAPQN